TGASAVNRILFTSQSGNAADVTLNAPALSGLGTDAVLRLDGGRYLDFQSLTLISTGGPSSSGTLIWMSGAPLNDHLLVLVMNGSAAGRRIVASANGTIEDGFELRTSQITFPSFNEYGVLFSTGSANSVVIQGNTFNSTTSAANAIDLTATTGS